MCVCGGGGGAGGGGGQGEDAFTYLLVSPVPFTVDDILLVVCFQGKDFTLTGTA